MKQTLFLLTLLILSFNLIVAQYPSNKPKQEIKGIPCINGSCLPFGLYSKPKQYFQSHTMHGIANGPDEMICGRFKVYFQDISMHTGYGFDDVRGPDRKATLCDVLNYIQSVIYIPPGDGSLIEIIVLESNFIPNQPTISTSLSLAGPFESSDFSNGVDGFYNGLAYDHLTTGIDPDINFYDGLLSYNFLNYNFADDNSAYNIYGNYCTYDLHRIMLHDMTHILGFRSLLQDDTITHIPVSFRQPFKQYSLMDKRSLFHGNVVTGNFIQVIDSNNLNIQTGAWSLREDSLWLNNTIAPFNIGLLANKPYESVTGYIPGHLNDWQDAFYWQGYLSPAMQPSIVMIPLFYEGIIASSKTYSNFELQFLQKLGYQFNSSFLNDTSLSGNNITNSRVLRNHYAYTTKKCIWSYLSNYYPSDSAVIDYKTDNCHPVTIDLTRDSTLHDLDGDSISIYPGSLYNIRGCGFHGNNHDRLVISHDRKKIIFYPRDNFIGRAQFGFDLYDGMERGMFIVYTIDVSKNDSCFNSNGNIVVNGDFEEGTEVRTYNNREIENAYFIGVRNGKYSYGGIFYDGDVYPFNYGQIRSSAMWCRSADSTFNGITFGNNVGSFDLPYLNNQYNIAFPSPVNNSGDRYSKGLFDRILSESLHECNKYRINFDINFNTFYYNNLTGSSVVSVIFTAIRGDYLPNIPYIQQVDIPVTFPVPSGWVHVDTTFIYCGSDTSNFINILTTLNIQEYYIDNLSLTKVPFGYRVTASADQYFCEGSHVNLHAELNDTNCTSTFHWSLLNNLSCYNCQDPVAFPVHDEQIIVTATVGNCPVIPDTVNLLFQTTLPSLDLGGDTAFCSGNSLTLYNHSPSFPVTWWNGFTGDSVTINNAGVYRASVFDGCRHNYDTVNVTMNTGVTVNLGNDTVLCPGKSIVLSCPVADDYQWSTGDNTSSISVSLPALYNVVVLKNNCLSYDTILISDYQLRPDTVTNYLLTCNESPVELRAPSYAQNVLWNTGDQSQSISVNEAGVYISTFTDSICLSRKEYDVDIYPEIHSEIIKSGDTLFSSAVDSQYVYEWLLNDIQVQSSSQPFLFPIQQGNYILQIKDKNGCVYRQQPYDVKSSALFIYYDYVSQQIVIRGIWKGKLKVIISDALGQILLQTELNENVNIIPVRLQSIYLATACYFVTLESSDIHSTFKMAITPGN